MHAPGHPAVDPMVHVRPSTRRPRLIVPAIVISVALSLASLISGLIGTPAPVANNPAGAQIFGIHEPLSSVSSLSGVSPDQAAAMVGATGAESQRWQVDWHQVEPRAPYAGTHNYNFSAYDPMYQADIAN